MGDRRESGRIIPRRELLIGLGAAAAVSSASFVCGNLLLGEGRPNVNQKLASSEIPPLPEFISPDPNQRAMVILMKNKTDKIPFSSSYVKSLLTETTRFYQQTSYGNMHYKFALLDWQDVDFPLTQAHVDKISALGDSLVDHVPHLDSFQTRIYIAQSPDFQSWGGFGEKRQPNTYNRVWLPANIGQLNDPDGFEHELGHTLGLAHDVSFEEDIPNNYTSNEHNSRNFQYAGDSVMGENNSGFNGPERVALGWIRRDQVQTVKKDGEYTLAPLEAINSNNPLVLRLYKRDTGEFYYLEYRQPIREDIHDDNPGGLEFRIWNEQVGSPTRFILPWIYGSRLSTPALGFSDGNIFYDEINGIKVKQLHHSPHGVKTQITFDK